MSPAVDVLARRLASLPRPVVEVLVHRLVDALDANDAPWADLEHEPVEDGDPGEASMQPGWRPWVPARQVGRRAAA